MEATASDKKTADWGATNAPLILLLAAFVILALFYVFWIPAGEGVDEIPHFDTMVILQEQRAFTVQPTAKDGYQARSMAHHPPLYYIIGAVLLSVQNSDDRGTVFRPNPHFQWKENDGRNGWNVYIHTGQDGFPGEGAVRALFTVRLLGIISGIITLFALYRAFQLAFPAIDALPFFATAVIAFNPSFLFMSSTVHHDGLLAMWFALGAWWMMIYLKNAERRWPWLGGLLTGLAMLTKVTGVVLALGVATVIGIRAYRQRSWRLFWHDGLVAGTAALLVAAGWYIRNLLLYGDLLAWNAYSHNFAANLRSQPSFVTGVKDFFQQLSSNYWGGFGYMHITFPEIGRFLWIASAILLFGWLLLWFRERIFFARYAAPLLCGAVLLLGMLGVYVRFSSINLGAGHGRYLFPAAFSIGMLLAVGLLGWAGRRYYRFAAGATTILLLTYSIWLPLSQVLPLYAAPESTTSLPPAAKPLSAEVSPGVFLAGYEFDPSQPLAANETRDLVLYLRSASESRAISDPYLLLTLQSPAGQVLASSSLWPAASLPPESWPEGELLVVRVPLYLAQQALPAELILTIRAKNLSTEPVTLATLPTVGSAAAIDPASLPDDLEILFADALLLRGYTLPGTAAAPGESVPLQLYWEAIEDITADYTLFVHLLDSSGNLQAQLDRPAGGSLSPTSTWQQGQAWRDIYPLQLPSDLAPGSYTLQIGMYLWPSLERIPITGQTNDVLPLGELVVESP